jgi:hypothetical protein
MRYKIALTAAEQLQQVLSLVVVMSHSTSVQLFREPVGAVPTLLHNKFIRYRGWIVTIFQHVRSSHVLWASNDLLCDESDVKDDLCVAAEVVPYQQSSRSE